ncbi:MAG: hypothetical protein PVI24_01330 [Myxococcales bacterium]|jgi:hypothetical protein
MPHCLIRYLAFALVAVAACAGVQKKETMSFEKSLAASGFAMKLADTPDKIAQLEKMPQKKLVTQVYDGKRVYLYADAAGCKCLYAGGEEDYDALQARISQGEVADQEQAALDQDQDDTKAQWVDVEAYGGEDALPWW